MGFALRASPWLFNFDPVEFIGPPKKQAF